MKETKRYIDIAIAEVKNPELEVTKQYLEVCELDYNNGLPIIERVDIDKGSDACYVYFKVKNENYYIKVCVETLDNPKLYFTWTENSNRVYFTATSKKLTYLELSSYLKLGPLTGYSIGERKQFKNKEIDFSRVSFEPIKNRAYDLCEKLILLLDELEKDISGVVNLAKNANAQIAVHKYQYISGNAGLGLSQNIIERMNKLCLGIDIDTYIVGEPIK